MSEQHWEVIGGQDKGGILVREGRDLASSKLPERLSHAAVVIQTALEGERLCYRLLSGSGPSSGWVSIKLSEKVLLVPVDPPVHQDDNEEKAPPDAGVELASESKSFDPYKILNISYEATEQEIRSAFRKRSLKVHPDHHPDDPHAAAAFQTLVKAKDLLLDPLRRQMYNNRHGVGEIRENPFGRHWAENWQELFDELDPSSTDDDHKEAPLLKNPEKPVGRTSDSRIDLIVYGATGHTGMLACRLLERCSAGRSWALAGRDGTKLALIGEKFGGSSLFAGTFRTETAEDIQKLARTARIIVDLSGPKWQVGTGLVEACVQFGTHYIEASGGQGDALINKHVQDTLDAKARTAGVSLLFFCGWSSVMLDFGTWHLVQHFRKSHGMSTRRVNAYTWHHGWWPPGWGISGAQLLSHAGEDPRKFDRAVKEAGGPFLFGGIQPGGMRQEDKDDVWVSEDSKTGMWITSSTLHDQLVPRCSCGLLDGSQSYGDSFSFKSLVISPERQDAEWLVMSSMSTKFDRESYVKKGKIAAPGQGPTKYTRYMKAVTTVLVGESDNLGEEQPRKAYVVLAVGPGGVGEPAGATAAFTLNAAICFLNSLDSDEPNSSLRPGFGTPVYHLAHLGFLEVLESMGLSFRVFDGPAPRGLFQNIVIQPTPIQPDDSSMGG